MRIERIEIRNYRCLRHTVLADLPRLTVVVGAAGAGKSTLFDVFSFLKESLTSNVALAVARRGGFEELRTRGQSDPIGIALKFRESGGRLATYSLSVAEHAGRAVVENEVLQYRRGRCRPWRFVSFSRGAGVAITNESAYREPNAEAERRDFRLDDPSISAVKGLGQFRDFPVVCEFRRLIENWRLPESRPGADAAYAAPLSPRGEGVAAAARFLYEHHRDRFDHLLRALKARVPEIESVEVRRAEDGRVLLRFREQGFRDPFLSHQVSDGTVGMFAHLVLLHAPKSHPLLAVERPERHLHPHLREELAEDFRAYAHRGGQALVSTHSPDFLNGAELREVFCLVKENGVSTARRASDDDLLRNLAREGDLPGTLWRQGLLPGS